MTISATGRLYSYSGDAITTAFSFPRPFPAATDLRVYLVLISTGVATLQTLSTHYTVSGAGDPSGGTVTFLSAPSAANKVVIFSALDAVQNLDLDAVTSWPMTSIEAAFDYATMMVQELWDRLSRTIAAPRERINTFDYTMPLPVATKVIAVNATGTALEMRPAVGSTWIVGAGAPGGSTGTTGDMYLDTATGDVYGPKTTVWGGITLNIRGPAGAMTGPGSSTNNEVAAFNGTTGAILKGSGFTYDKIVRLDTANTYTAGKQTFVASTSGSATFNVPPGTAPSSPAAGDVWTTTTDMFVRLNGVTETVAFISDIPAVPPTTLGKHTIWVPASAMIARTTAGAAAGTVETTTNKVMIKTLDFDATTQEFAQFAIQMPKSWNEGTIIAQFIWSHAATATNFGVVWALEAVAFNDNDAGDAAFGTAQQVADTGGTTNNIYRTAETAAITVAGSPTAEEWVVFQVKRAPADASDTMAIDARLLGVKIHYTTDAGSDS